MSQHIEFEALSDQNKLNIREGETNNRKWKQISQFAWLHTTGEKYPVKCAISIENEADAYAAGNYDINEKSIIVGDYDALSFARYPILTPQAKAATQQRSQA